MGTIRQKWYPSTLETNTPTLMGRTLRRILDMIYEGSEQLNPLSFGAVGTDVLTLWEDGYVGVPGCRLRLIRAGWWVVTGSFTINVIGADTAKIIKCGLFFSGTTPAFQKDSARVKVTTEPTTISVAHSWRIKSEANASIQLQVHKETGATGTSTVDGPNSSIVAVWEGL